MHVRLRPILESWPDRVDMRLLSREDVERYQGFALRILLSGRKPGEGIAGLFSETEIHHIGRIIRAGGIMIGQN